MLVKTEYLIFCFLLVAGNVCTSFGQNYLNAEQDVGFDIARTIVTDATIRTEPKYTALLITTFKTGYNLTLLNRKNVGGWYEVSDINSLKRGWINGSQITLYLSNGNFHQAATELGIKCVDPLYLAEAEDRGYDIVRLTPKYNPKGELYRQTMFLDGTGESVISYDKSKDLFLLSRELVEFKFFGKTVSGFKVLDLEEGAIGYVFCSSPTYYTRKQKQETESPFVKQRSSNSYATPVTTIQNDADRDLTLFIDDEKYIIPTKSTKTLTLSAGRHSFVATAPGVIPLSGSDIWEQGYVYSWTFYIVTSRR